jgi:hypothetical protein
MKNCEPGRLRRGKFGNSDGEPALDVAPEILTEFGKPREARVLLPHHPGAAPDLVGVTTLGHVESNLLDRGAGFRQALRSGTADIIDLALHADAGDIGSVSDPQTPCIARARDGLVCAAPWRCDRDRGEAAKSHHRV